jgi:hypothetical protein
LCLPQAIETLPPGTDTIAVVSHRVRRATKNGQATASALDNFESLAVRFPGAEGVFVEVHVDALAAKLYFLDAEAKALFGCGFTS